VYIPSLKLGFEINGPVHYQPIFGEAELKKVQSKDISKYLQCVDKSISLFSIDISKIGPIKITKIEPFLIQIKNTIDRYLK